ncbi:hypothetical protein OCGS_0816 [Oceaniovalibus guishaninsula JLT2003]|uniref:SAM-dependent methyltransferase n=1 Tax=Oceaniovalibus guishaninsula JLT2003 TaxID=1231392 RepID=K2GRB0_9RHOB|nr:class I SAM-dependent rRNA methyltransferase [Oceaniovalibus guishaninsula]EKE45121.1 hypothetical protein OCGS_0816 [Oceaniovalibus guishaninsula JLT2003]
MTQPRSDLPVVRLRPKANARAIRHGAPWVFADELVVDRRTGKLPGGTIALLEDADRNAMGVVAVNPASKIIARMLDRNPQATIDTSWFAGRIARALDHRERLYERPFYRLIHAEADGLPGVVVDRFGDALAVQPNAAWADNMLETLVDALQAVTGAGVFVKNAGGRTRALEGLDDRSDVIRGSVGGPVAVPMNGAVYLADLTGGQKTGLFFDQRENHAFAARLARGQKVLDVFSHVGGFALAMLAGGAENALAVDASAPALALASEGAERSGTGTRFGTRQGDAFAVMEGLAREGARFGVVVCDPPAFAPAKPAREAGLRAYERVARMAAGLVADGGYLCLCSCSHAVDMTAFRDASARGIGRAGRVSQLVHSGSAGPDHPVLPQLAESGYLKSLFFRL